MSHISIDLVYRRYRLSHLAAGPAGSEGGLVLSRRAFRAWLQAPPCACSSASLNASAAREGAGERRITHTKPQS